MKGWILYKRSQEELTDYDHGVNRLLAAATDFGVELKVYKPEQFDLLVSGKQDFLLESQQVDLPDFVLPRLGAETSYLAMALIRQLENAGVYSCNTSNAIANVKDKLFLSQLIARAKLPFPRTMLMKFPLSTVLVNRLIGFPLIIKNVSGARGIGIYLCDSSHGFSDLIELIHVQHNEMQLILQEFIATSYGRDLRIFIIGNKITGCIQRTAQEGFKANYSLGGKVSSFPLTTEISDLALKCAKLCSLEIAGIDLLFAENGFKICEANSAPGFKGLEQALQKDVAFEIMSYIVAATKKHQQYSKN